MVRSTRSSTVTRLSALETDPDLAVLEVLLLPDGHRPLERVDRVPARLERLRAVRRRHGDEHARLTDLEPADAVEDRKSTRLNSSHVANSYAVFCLKKKNSSHRCISY